MLALFEDAPIAGVDLNVSLACEVTQNVLL